MSTHTPTSTAEPAVKMTHREVLEALSGILLGMFVSILATSIVSSSLPKIITDLGGTQSAFTWVVTATLLTTTISTPIWGKLADLVDRKLLIQLALVISVISAAAAGFAQDTSMLIAMRALQGIGAGGLTALGTVLIADIISPRERGRYMGLMGAVMGVATVGGPLLGGVLTDSVGWRWNFFVGLPVALAAIIVLQRTLHLPARRPRAMKIDYAGAALLSVGIATLLLWITFAGTSFDWASWQTAAMLGTSVLTLGTAVWVESRASEPMIPLHLFKNRTLVLAVIASIAVGVAMFGTSVFLSQYMQLARGMTPTVSGLLTIPQTIGLLVASTVSGRIISRTGKYKTFMIVGSVMLTAGLGLMGTIHFDTPLVLIALYMVINGAGVGMLMQNLVLATQNTLDVTEIGSGTSTVAFFRTLGGTLGVSALGVVLSHQVMDLMARGLDALGIDPGVLGSGGAIPDLSTLPENIRIVVEQSYGDAVANLFLLAAPVALISLIAVLFLKEIPLGTRSGIELLLEREGEMLAPATAEASNAVEPPVSEPGARA